MRFPRARALGALAVATVLAFTALPDVADASSYTSTSWTTVVNDSFDGSTLPSHWKAYNGQTTRNCFRTNHSTVSGGYLHLKLNYEASGNCGAGWYSGGVTLTNTLSAPNQRITVRFRITNSNGIIGRRVVPMLNPDDGQHIGEQDLCESTGVLGWCHTFLHYGAPGTYQVRQRHYVDLRQWHTMTYTMNGDRVIVVADGVTIWDYTGNSTTLPRKLRHVVMQQDCPKTGCPAGTAGYEDIQIASIKIENGN